MSRVFGLADGSRVYGNDSAFALSNPKAARSIVKVVMRNFFNFPLASVQRLGRPLARNQFQFLLLLCRGRTTHTPSDLASA